MKLLTLTLWLAKIKSKFGKKQHDKTSQDAENGQAGSQSSQMSPPSPIDYNKFPNPPVPHGSYDSDKVPIWDARNIENKECDMYGNTGEECDMYGNTGEDADEHRKGGPSNIGGSVEHGRKGKEIAVEDENDEDRIPRWMLGE